MQHSNSLLTIAPQCTTFTYSITNTKFIKTLLRCTHHNAKHNSVSNWYQQLATLGVWLEWQSPQKSRHTLTLSEVLTNAEDGQQLYDRAVAYTKLLVEPFPSLEKLKPLISTGNSTSVKKSVVVLMKILFKDEKYIDDNIQILQQYIEDGNLSGNAQVSQCLITLHSFKHTDLLY